MLFATKQQLAKLNLDDLANKFPIYSFSASLQLVTLLDQELTFAPHRHRLSRNCYYHLRQLRTVARSLTASAATTLVHAFITSRLDYCSTLCTGLPECRCPVTDSDIFVLEIIPNFYSSSVNNSYFRSNSSSQIISVLIQVLKIISVLIQVLK